MRCVGEEGAAEGIVCRKVFVYRGEYNISRLAAQNALHDHLFPIAPRNEQTMLTRRTSLNYARLHCIRLHALPAVKNNKTRTSSTLVINNMQ